MGYDLVARWLGLAMARREGFAARATMTARTTVTAGTSGTAAELLMTRCIAADPRPEMCRAGRSATVVNMGRGRRRWRRGRMGTTRRVAVAVIMVVQTINDDAERAQRDHTFDQIIAIRPGRSRSAGESAQRERTRKGATKQPVQQPTEFTSCCGGGPDLGFRPDLRMQEWVRHPCVPFILLRGAGSRREIMNTKLGVRGRDRQYRGPARR